MNPATFFGWWRCRCCCTCWCYWDCSTWGGFGSFANQNRRPLSLSFWIQKICSPQRKQIWFQKLIPVMGVSGWKPLRLKAVHPNLRPPLPRRSLLRHQDPNRRHPSSLPLFHHHLPRLQLPWQPQLRPPHPSPRLPQPPPPLSLPRPRLRHRHLPRLSPDLLRPKPRPLWRLLHPQGPLPRQLRSPCLCSQASGFRIPANWLLFRPLRNR